MFLASCYASYGDLTSRHRSSPPSTISMKIRTEGNYLLKLPRLIVPSSSCTPSPRYTANSVTARSKKFSGQEPGLDWEWDLACRAVLGKLLRWHRNHRWDFFSLVQSTDKSRTSRWTSTPLMNGVVVGMFCWKNIRKTKL